MNYEELDNYFYYGIANIIREYTGKIYKQNGLFFGYSRNEDGKWFHDVMLFSTAIASIEVKEYEEEVFLERWSSFDLLIIFSDETLLYDNITSYKIIKQS